MRKGKLIFRISGTDVRATIYETGDLRFAKGSDKDLVALIRARVVLVPGSCANVLRAMGDSAIEDFPGSRWDGTPPPLIDGEPWELDPWDQPPTT